MNLCLDGISLPFSNLSVTFQSTEWHRFILCNFLYSPDDSVKPTRKRTTVRPENTCSHNRSIHFTHPSEGLSVKNFNLKDCSLGRQFPNPCLKKCVESHNIILHCTKFLRWEGWRGYFDSKYDFFRSKWFCLK